MSYLLSNTFVKITGLFIACIIFFLSFILSLSLGQTSIPFHITYEAFFHFNESVTEHVIITTSRLARAIIAAVIGASLSVAGALMQALTRNPLAAPDIFGVNAGAIFFIVFSATFFSIHSLINYMWIGFFGAGLQVCLFIYLDQ